MGSNIWLYKSLAENFVRSDSRPNVYLPLVLLGTATVCGFTGISRRGILLVVDCGCLDMLRSHE